MTFDFAIIGGGSAGFAAARTASALGLKTVVIEGGRQVGGLCILRGCMPSKTLIESANRFITLRRAEEFGLHAHDIGFSGSTIIERKRRLIGEFAHYREEQLNTGHFEMIRGIAHFLNPYTIEVTPLDNSNSIQITAESFLISTGSIISTPLVPGLRQSNCMTSDDLLECSNIPSSAIVLGAGPVALEAAYYLASLKTKVTLIQRSPRILKGTDLDLSEALRKALEELGIEIIVDTSLQRVERTEDGYRVTFEHNGRTETRDAQALLNALGREPAIAGLQLDKAGIELNGKQIRVSDTQQTSVPHIFAAGDVCGPYEIVHLAIMQGEVAARNAAKRRAGEEKKRTPETFSNSDDANDLASSQSFKMDYRLKIFVTFTEPQLATVGWNETELKAQGVPYVVATYPFNDHGKSIVMGETHGFVKLIAHKTTGEILGGGVVGPHASDLIHEIVVAMAFHSTVKQLAAIPHYHPTLSEIWTYPAEELAERLTNIAN